ncbi:hypothetical protein PaeBR_06325 [Paenibacillus sp. BR2-3]|uniref:hypothetical protein n=1 Tax=Paenibacillus sp. BR2-3 TaxID=3048494 RepID=UPI003977ADF3
MGTTINAINDSATIAKDQQIEESILGSLLNKSKEPIELVDQRTQFTRTFKNSDDTYTTVSSGQSINYYNNNNKWEPIDTDIVLDNTKSGYDYEVSKNNIKTKFPKSINNSIRIGDDVKTIQYKAMSTSGSQAVITNNKIQYTNAWKNTDLIYQVNNDFIKMEIQLKNSEAPNKFRFELITHGLSYRVNSDHSIDFVNKQNKVEYTIPPMWVKDSSSNDLRYDLIQMEIEKSDSKSYISMTLNDQGLVYPLVIDPTTISISVSGNTTYPNQTNLLNVKLPFPIHKKEIQEIKYLIFGKRGDYYMTGAQFYATLSNYENQASYSPNIPQGYNMVDVSNGLTKKYDSAGALECTIPYSVIQDKIPNNSPMVYGGMVWLGSTSTSFLNMAVTYKADNSQIVSHTFPSKVFIDNSYTFDISIKNTGELTWSPGTAGYIEYMLFNETLNRFFPMYYNNSVPPGGTALFKITLTAPPEVGNISYVWRMAYQYTPFGATLQTQAKVVEKGIKYYYDSANRLTNIEKDGDVIRTYEYDKNGNLKYIR